MRRGLLTTALCASLSPRFVNLGADDWPSDVSTPLVVACASAMARGTQRRLADFIRAGGKALFAPILPTLDENFEPCTLLADFLGAPPMRPSPRGVAHPKVMQVSNVSGKLYFPQGEWPAPAKLTVLGVDEMTGLPFAFKKGFETGGQAVVLGIEWVHAMREHERMLKALLEGLGLRQAVVCSNPNLWATATPNGYGFTVFVLNLFTAPFDGEVTVGGRSTGVRTFAPMTVAMLEI